MELSPTVLCPAEEQCRLAVQAQEEDEQVKKNRSASSKSNRYQGRWSDSYALPRPHWQASDTMFTAHIAYVSSCVV